MHGEQHGGAGHGVVQLSDSARIDHLVRVFRDHLEAFASWTAENERVVSTEQTMEIVRAVLWLNASRVGSAAAVYALDSLVQALGSSMLAAIAHAQAFNMATGKGPEDPKRSAQEP